jgi:hypothetical protein
VRHHPQPHVLGAFPRIAAHRALVYARLLLARNLPILSERTWSRAMVATHALRHDRAAQLGQREHRITLSFPLSPPPSCSPLSFPLLCSIHDSERGT